MKTLPVILKNPALKKLNFSLTLALLLSLALALALVLPARSAALTSYVVNSTNDVNDGTCDATHCSLREAIKAANASAGGDMITFNISGCSGGVCTIQPAIGLPDLSGGSITIDGTTAVDQIEIDGSSIASSGYGIFITSANNTVRGLVINRFVSAGVFIFGSGATGNVIRSNYIGVDATGMIARPNQFGIWIANGDSNTIGGDSTVGGRNVISGNTDAGIFIENSNSNTISANYIGLAMDGVTALGNGGTGVDVSGDQNIIGGESDQGEGNLISANLGSGISIDAGCSAGPCKNNIISGNSIGVDKNGAADRGNAQSGVSCYGSQNTIGGNTSAKGNLISGNNSNGISLYGAGNTVMANTIGLDAAGAVALPNQAHGIWISNTANNIIGGDYTAARNVISGNGQSGIEIDASNINTISGNYIGVDVTGLLDRGNTDEGVYISNGSYGNLIGGDTTSQRNIISGNDTGVKIGMGYQNTVGANYIGVDANGTGDLGNTLYGVSLSAAAHHNTIGGNVASPRNIISGNGSYGVNITGDGTDENLVQGNYIGVDSTGSAALANGDSGVYISSQAALNTIGGDTSVERNVISGNVGSGVTLYLNSEYNLVTGNYIGLNWNGTASLGNSLNGVLISGGSHHNTIGGDHDLGLGNVISNNTFSGVMITGVGTDANTVAGNYIGVNPAGSADWGNGDSGVVIQSDASYNIIGGAYADGFGNVISGNSDYGVYMNGSATAYNQVRGNTIGLNAAGDAALGNTLDGVYISTASNNTIGGAALYRNLISGNLDSGVVIGGTSAVNNSVTGNIIGLDVTGAVDLGNTDRGVWIYDGANDNRIGAESDDGRNVISGNGVNGVEINGSATFSNTVAFNYIGVDVTGALDRGNTGSGVLINGGANRNTIGGDASGERNIISGNGTGVKISGIQTISNTVSGNYIGVNALGAAALGNFGIGVEISDGAHNNTIGGDTSGERNIISSNGTGVAIIGPSAYGNVVSANYIGLDAAGSAALPGVYDGIHILAGAHNNTIGGDASGERNVISGNAQNGVFIEESDSINNIISGNYIGLTASGNGAIPNGLNGIALVSGANHNTIGGDHAGQRNIISGNAQNGILIEGLGTSNNVVLGNYIGLRPSGLSALPNQQNGILIRDTAASNTIGGGATGEGNVISGNSENGVYITGSGVSYNIILGNYIGADASGSIALPNQDNGVFIDDGASNTLIGGDTSDERNVISGNLSSGVFLSAFASSNTVSGNYIGITSDGSASLGNGVYGVSIVNADHNTIGGNTSGQRNIISGSGQNGVFIGNPDSAYNVVAGNYIGLNAAGTAALHNHGSGVVLVGGAHDNTIGGNTSAYANYISGNSSRGISISGTNTNENVVRFNYIGIDTKGDALGNGDLGIYIGNDASLNTIGPSNVVTNNPLGGIQVQGSSTLQNLISQNSIYSNGGLGIDLVDNAHGRISRPVILDITYGLGTFTISGTSCYSCVVEVFGNPNTDAEGMIYLGVDTANSSGTWSVVFNSLPFPSHPVLTATAYDSVKGTSEFSNPFYVPGKNLFLPLIVRPAPLSAQAQAATPFTAEGHSAPPSHTAMPDRGLWHSKQNQA